MLKTRIPLHITGLFPIVLMLTACHTPNKDNTEALPSIDYILVEKSNRTLIVYNKEKELRKYNISLSKNPKGHKVREGDHRTPEGVYTISEKKPKSKYYKALTISYPNDEDRKKAAKLGVSPGGGVQIHGYEPKYAWVQQHHKLIDATRGCILLTNAEMEQIYNATEVGTKIEIKP